MHISTYRHAIHTDTLEINFNITFKHANLSFDKTEQNLNPEELEYKSQSINRNYVCLFVGINYSVVFQELLR